MYDIVVATSVFSMVSHAPVHLCMASPPSIIEVHIYQQIIHRKHQYMRWDFRSVLCTVLRTSEQSNRVSLYLMIRISSRQPTIESRSLPIWGPSHLMHNLTIQRRTARYCVRHYPTPSPNMRWLFTQKEILPDTFSMGLCNLFVLCIWNTVWISQKIPNRPVQDSRVGFFPGGPGKQIFRCAQHLTDYN